MTMNGKQTDVTQDFYACLFQKFEAGYAHTVNCNGKPKYRITVEDLEKKEGRKAMLNLDCGQYPCVQSEACKYLQDEMEREGTKCVVIYSCDIHEDLKTDCDQFEPIGEKQ